MRAIGTAGASEADVAQALNELAGGRFSNGMTVTLTANVATTTVVVRGLNPLDAIFFDPLTLNAATQLYNGTMYILEANRTSLQQNIGQVVITHTNNAQTDRKFRMTWQATL